MLMNNDKFEIKVPADQLIGLMDLIWRWPYESALKIAKEIYESNLQMFMIDTVYNPELDARIFYCLFPHLHFCESFEYCSYKFDSIALLLSEVEEIEKAKPHYKNYPDNPGKDYERDFVTISNSCTVVPQILYTILTCNFTKRRSSITNVRSTLHSNDIEYPKAFRNKERSSWTIPHQRLWAKFKLNPASKFLNYPVSDNDLAKFEDFLNDKRAKGYTSDEIMMNMVAEYIPFLTDYQLGPVNTKASLARSSVFLTDKARGKI